MAGLSIAKIAESSIKELVLPQKVSISLLARKIAVFRARFKTFLNWE